MNVLVVPSILAADFGHLADQVAEAVDAGADRIQIDVMDGHFVPNLSMGPAIVEAVRRFSKVPLEVHLMVERPEQFIPVFASAGADLLQVQVESTYSLYRALQLISEHEVRPGVAINPGTPVDALRELVPYVTQVNVMTVEPGFGGQAFIASAPEKIRRVRELVGDQIEVEVDGGIDAETAPRAVEAGANVLVAGNAVFAHPGGIAAGINAIREAVHARP